MKHIQLLFAAMTFASTGFCQKGETAIEFNLTDLTDGWAVNVSRIDKTPLTQRSLRQIIIVCAS